MWVLQRKHKVLDKVSLKMWEKLPLVKLFCFHFWIILKKAEKHRSKQYSTAKKEKYKWTQTYATQTPNNSSIKAAFWLLWKTIRCFKIPCCCFILRKYTPQKPDNFPQQSKRGEIFMALVPTCIYFYCINKACLLTFENSLKSFYL